MREAAREVDPRTPVGIEGTQMPHAFGGYDLWRLSQVLDWVEPYDIGNAREIFGSFMPGKPILTTVFENDTNPARRRLWHLLLEGDRGCIVWWSEDCMDWQSEDYRLTPKAKALAPVLQRNDLAAGAAVPAGRARARPGAHSLLAAEHPGGLAARIDCGWLHLAAAVLQLRGGPQPDGPDSRRAGSKIFRSWATARALSHPKKSRAAA